MTGHQVLSGLRVLDLTRGMAGEFCTRMFGDFGAEVVKVEKPGVGSLTRCRAPFAGDKSDRESSAVFLNLNFNKRSVTLDLHSPAGGDLVLRLAAHADLVVESFRPGRLESFGLGPDRLQSANERLVLTRISPFGQTGPYRDYQASGLVLQAMGGPMNATGAADAPPHRKPGALEQYSIGRMAAEASMAGLLAARRFGEGSVVDIAGFEVLLAGADRRACYLLTAAYAGINAPRGVRSVHRASARLNGPYTCSDGHVLLYVTSQQFWNRLIALVADGDADFLSRFADRWGRLEPREQSEFEAMLRTWMATRSKSEIMERAQALRLPITAVLTIPEILQNQHFRSRGCFTPAVHPTTGTLDYVGPPWRMEGGWRLRRTAPLLGEHTAEVLGEVGVTAGDLDALRAQGVV